MPKTRKYHKLIEEGPTSQGEVSIVLEGNLSKMKMDAREQIENITESFTDLQDKLKNGTFLSGRYDSDGEPLEMTDKEKYELYIRFITATSKIKLDDLKMKEQDMLHIDAFNHYMKQFFEIVKRYIRDQDEVADFANEIGGIPHPQMGRK